MSAITDLIDRMPRWDRIWTRTTVPGFDFDQLERMLEARRQLSAARHSVDPVIAHYEGINHTPAFAIAHEGHLALLRDELSVPAQIVNWDDRAVVASIGGEPAGVMIWREVKHWREISLDLGYVRPAYRRQGVYRAMWDALVVKAQELGAERIMSATYLDNAAMRAAAARLGRREETVGIRFDVPPRKDAVTDGNADAA